ncbi:ABC transporter permease [Aneurinibacillus danicus]|jgi:lipopolysaccharide transport system permease protein/teichoic acid transport system permease protein|uniref:Transport permease protein n=1 Tax=Aneurinibacillus danicus TaxID=267746 RepID=A0A511V868_9BACL|nr:ABC transporter permease [Aneurinibacillus danicus]GEN35145.1 transport permease protein [Aneurinibacillus danicus]
MGQLSSFIKSLFQSRNLILELAKKDFRSRYLGSYLGIVWAFIQPTIMVLIFWFVFQVGFKSMPVDNFPFILWLICGMVPWFFFSDGLNSATTSIIENSYLVKKVVFRVSILPFVKITSGLFVHSFFICVLFLMFAIYGYYPNVYSLQVLYYSFAMMMLVLGISWITSSLIIFLKDVGQIIAMILQFGFWLTPIFYSMKIVPEKYHFLMKLNPMYYIVEGYRDTFIHHIWFWHHYKLTAYYWSVTFGLFIIGIFVFKKLRPHFADVL